MSIAQDKDIGPEDEAGDWDARLRAPDCSEEDRAAHRAWRDADPANAEAFESLQALIGGLPAMGARPEIQSMREAALKRLDEPDAEPAAEPTDQQRPWPRRWLPIGSAIAASLALIVFASLYILQPDGGPGATEIAASDPAPSFATAIGERTTVPLTDGSAAILNTDSRIDIRYAEAERGIVLVQGEAHFDVAHDPERPFIVYAGDYKVIAIGTAFDVRMEDDDVQVTVTEGRVSVVRISAEQAGNRNASADLVAGQQMDASATGQALLRSADIASVSSWREGHAVFDDIPLSAAAREMNRYSTVKLTIADQRLAMTRISGMFMTGEQDSFVEALERYFPVRARRVSATEILLEPAPAS